MLSPLSERRTKSKKFDFDNTPIQENDNKHVKRVYNLSNKFDRNKSVDHIDTPNST